MGKQPFPREDKLRFIIQRISEGASDAQIEQDLLKYGPSGKVPFGQYGAFGEVGIRTLRNIRQVYQVAKELIKTQTEQLDLNIGKANDEHLAQIQALIQRWRNSFDARYRPVDVYVFPPRYGVEQDKLFPYVLDHCPSINTKYQALLTKKNEYQIQSSEPEKSQSGQWRQAFVEAEGKLRDALDTSLLSHEYMTHKCGLCPGFTPSNHYKT